MRNVVCTSDAPGVGHYSQAVKGGGFIFVSGQLALDPVTQQIIEGDSSQQTERALLNVATIRCACAAALACRSDVNSDSYITTQTLPMCPPALRCRKAALES
jgi:enamine deaminase RidA (YjgF/YER057c/UK114 family)